MLYIIFVYSIYVLWSAEWHPVVRYLESFHFLIIFWIILLLVSWKHDSWVSDYGHILNTQYLLLYSIPVSSFTLSPRIGIEVFPHAVPFLNFTPWRVYMLGIRYSDSIHIWYWIDFTAFVLGTLKKYCFVNTVFKVISVPLMFWKY